MAKKKSAQRAKQRALAKTAQEAMRLRWVTVGCSIAALVFSLFPWLETPAWLTQLDTLTSNTTMALDMNPNYGLLSFADLATELGQEMSQPVLTWALGAAEALWVAGLTFIVLGVGGTLTHRIFGEQQLRRFLAWGSGFTIASAVVSLIFMPLSSSSFQTHFSGAASNLSGYLSYVGGVEATSQGFGVSIWLFISLGFAVVAFGCAIAESVKVSQER